MACVQNAYNLTVRSEQALFDACRDDGVAFVPFFPLGSAFFAEKPVLGAPAVRAAAVRLGATPAQVALAWLLPQAPNVLLIPGCRRWPTWRRTWPPVTSSSTNWPGRP